MKYIILILVSLLLSSKAIAGNINYLKIKGDTVEFSTDSDKSHQLPTCVSSDNSSLYAFSLTSESGRATYSLLVTALSSEQAIDVTSGSSCFADTGIENVDSVAIAPTTHLESNLDKSLYLYSGDGNTKVGRIVGTKEDDIFYYLPLDNLSEIRGLGVDYINSPSYLYFKAEDCSGDALTTSSLRGFNPYYNGGKYFIKSGPTIYDTTNYALDENGNCITIRNTSNKKEVKETTLEPCGDKPCVIKEG